mgnify:CR=1 FL=1
MYEIDLEKLKISLPMLCSDFFTLLPTAYANDNIERLIDAMDSYSDINFCSQNKRQRTLADFDTYFIFDEIIKDYWKSSLSMEDRLFYYPLYLWWMITGVLPLRPREFLLTQRNCLIKNSDDAYYLKLRRNKLKGGRKNISYKLSDDYIVNTYKIPDYLGDEIQDYIDLTSKYDGTDIDTLFVTDPHYKKWGHSKHSDSRYLTYINMTGIKNS